MIKRRATIALLSTLLIGSQPLVAQDVADEETPTTLKGFFMIGWQTLDLDELNGRMIGNGFPSFSENMLSLGGGGWGRQDRFLIGGEGHALLGSEEATSNGAFRTRIEGGYGQLDLGYRVYAGQRLDVSPIIGLGGGAVAVDLVERGSPTFDDVLSDPFTSTKLSAAGFLFDLSLAIEVQLTRREKEDGDEDGFALGLRGGYAYSPGGWDWRVNDETDAPGGPQIGIRGPYLRLMLGGWGRGSNGR